MYNEIHAGMHKQLRARDWWTFPTIISLAAGLLTNFRFQLVGRVSIGEIVLAVVACFAILANIGNPRFWNRRVWWILFALCVSFCGYVLSDLINSTPTARLERGWARMAFVIIDFIAIWALARNSVVNVFAVCVGDALSSVLSYGKYSDNFLYNYKFHFAMPMTVFVMIVMPLVWRRTNIATGVAMIGVGMCHFWLDFRLAGGICVLIGFILIARCVSESRLRSLYLSLLALALIVGSVAVTYLYSATNESFAGRRQYSDSDRLSMAMAGINAIERSPIFGLGSWVWDTEMSNVYSGTAGRTGIDPSTGEGLAPHSQVIQAWAEAGLLGLVFFLYFGKILVQALWFLVFRRPLDIMTSLFLYNLLLGLWNLLFSPFANLHRFAIGLALVVSVQVLREGASQARAHRIALVPVPYPGQGDAGPWPGPFPFHAREKA